MAQLKKRYTKAVINLNKRAIQSILDELTVYKMDSCISFEEIENHELLVCGYLRSINQLHYSRDIRQLVLQFALVDIIKEDIEVTTLKNLLWDGGRPSDRVAIIISKAKEGRNWAFITEWLLRCMWWEQNGTSTIDLQQFKCLDITTQKNIFLYKDTFLNATFLDWLCKKWHASALFSDTDFLICAYEGQHDYMIKWLKYHKVKRQEIAALFEYNVKNSHTVDINTSFVLSLALHGLLREGVLPVSLIDLSDIFDQLTSRADSSDGTILLRYYLRYFISRSQCKEVLTCAINSASKLRKKRFVYTQSVYLSKNETYFFSIFLEIMIEAKLVREAANALSHHAKKVNVIAPISQTNQAIIWRYISSAKGIRAVKANITSLLVQGYYRKSVGVAPPSRIGLLIYGYLDEKISKEVVKYKNCMKHDKQFHRTILGYAVRNTCWFGGIVGGVLFVYLDRAGKHKYLNYTCVAMCTGSLLYGSRAILPDIHRYSRQYTNAIKYLIYHNIGVGTLLFLLVLGSEVLA